VYQGLASRYPGCRNTETSRLIRAIIISGFRKSGFRDMRRQKVSHLGFPGAETPKPKLISGFRKSDFATGEYKGTDPWVSRVPKHRNIQTLDTLCHFGVSQVGISGLASTRDLPLDIPGAETPKHQISSTLLSFRGLASRDFGTGEYKRLALRYPGCQTPKHQISSTLLSFRGFASQDFTMRDKRSRT
jgi:hypothetical protein